MKTRDAKSLVAIVESAKSLVQKHGKSSSGDVSAIIPILTKALEGWTGGNMLDALQEYKMEEKPE